MVIKENDKIKVVTFRDFDSYFDDDLDKQWIDVSDKNIYTLSNNGEFTKVNKLLRRKENSNIYHVTTKSGNELRATSDHKTILNDGTELKVSDLKIGDKLPIAKYPAFNRKKEINLIDVLDENDASIVIHNTEYVSKFIPSDIKQIIETRLSNLKPNHVWKYLSLKEYKLLRNRMNIDEHNIELMCKRSNGNYINAILPLNKYLGKFLGYIASEGSINHEQRSVVFANKDEILTKEYINCINNCFPHLKVAIYERPGNRVSVTHIFGNIIVKLFSEHGLLYKKDSHDMKLNEQLFLSNEDFVNGFFSAMIDGDGNVPKTQECCSVGLTSKTLIYQMAKWLSYNNVSSYIQKINSKGTIAHFGNTESVRKFDTWKLHLTSGNYVAFKQLVKDCHKIDYNVLNQPKWNSIEYGDIVSIEQEPYNDWVYDFETENHLFVANGIVTHNCLQVDLQKTFKDGFKIGSSYIREPQSIRSAASLACIVLQSSQNNMFGGQSIQDFDRAMAEGVRRSFKKEFEECSKNLAMVSDVSEDTVEEILKQKQDEYPMYKNDKNIDKLTNDKSLNKLFKNAYKLACKRVEEETHQAMESVIFNLNSMHSRAGSQVNKCAPVEYRNVF